MFVVGFGVSLDCLDGELYGVDFANVVGAGT